MLIKHYILYLYFRDIMYLQASEKQREQEKRQVLQEKGILYT